MGLGLTRRQVCASSGAVLVAALADAGRVRASVPELADGLLAIERDSGGRLGVAIFDMATGRSAGHRLDERFPMCSTFKALAAGAVLARVDAGGDRLDRVLRYEAADLVPYSPVTGPHAGQDGMTLQALCAAAVTVSDNTAGNLLLSALGGPAGLTEFLRGLGDGVTRLDRNEPDLNEALPDDPRDTTSPTAMARTLAALVCGDALSPASRDLLAGWLVGCRTGDKRLRAGLPASWRVGDKTGTGERGTANDVAVIWPPGRAPLVVTAFLTGTPVSPEARDAVLASVGRVVVSVVR